MHDQHASHWSVELATIAIDELHAIEVPRKHDRPLEGTGTESFTAAEARVDEERSRSRNVSRGVAEQAPEG